MMTVMFERFSDEARRTVVRALVEARRQGHDYVGTEHLLVGLVLARGAAADALASEGVTLDRLRLAVADVVGRGRGVSPWDDGPFTARARHTFELAKREAYEFGHRYVASGHVLLSVMQLGDASALRVLAHLGVDLDVLRQKVEDTIATERPPLAPAEHHSRLARPPAIAGALVWPSPPAFVEHEGVDEDEVVDDEPVVVEVEVAVDADDVVEDEVPQIVFRSERRAAEAGASRMCSFCGHALGAEDRFVAGVEALICAGCAHAAARLVGGGSPTMQGGGAAYDVTSAFAVAFDAARPDHERAASIEDGDLLAPLLAWVHEPGPADAPHGARVEDVRFLDDRHALVRYAVDLGGAQLRQVGWARRDGAGWRVTRPTYAAVLARAGIPPL
jgi:hypothetical protein